MFLCTYTTNRKPDAAALIKLGLTMISTNESAAFFQDQHDSISEAIARQDDLRALGYEIMLTKTRKLGAKQ